MYSNPEMMEKEVKEPAVDLQDETLAEPSGNENEGTSLGDDVESLKAEISSLQEKLLRQAAEFQNYKKRSEMQLGHSITTGKVIVVRELLDIFDDLERSVAAHDEMEGEGEQNDSSLSSGVKLVYEKFKAELTRLGVRPIDAVGSKFDEEMHEAMMQQDAPEGVESDIVLAEIQKGYTLGDRVIRHSKVVVAR